MLPQSEEHNQLFCQPSIEFLVCFIHFVHFTHPHMNPLPPSYGKAYHKASTYANAKDFVIEQLNFVKVSQEND